MVEEKANIKKIIMDAENTVVGRIGTYVAKELLKGKEVAMINVDKAIISGNKKDVLGRIQSLRAKGGSSQKGPKISKDPEKLVKRMVRGMLPRYNARGRQAYKKLKCYASTSEEIKNFKKEDLDKAVKLNLKKPIKFMSIKQIIELI